MTQLRKIESAPAIPFLGSLLGLDQEILDAVPLGIYACDADGLILRVNRKATELWGRTPRLQDSADRFCGSFRVESLDGQVIPPDQLPMARAVLLGEGARGVEAVVQNSDGRRWIARVDVEPLRDAQGLLIGAINCFQDVTAEHELRQASARQQRTFDLAMIASQMGTWRYTIADNICIYDDNAQRLYGLTEARFLHDEAGVKDKFHPDDMDLMWKRVGVALDPTGDGRYEVEYRVKQLDGSWRWLSAWGLVEFEGQGSERKPVAIAGASRDLTERKKAEEVEHLLISELNHRVKNTLTIVQSLASQSLRGASDLDSGRKALEARIHSLARAHDLLIKHNGIGADLGDVVTRAVEPFGAAKTGLAGPPVHVSPKHALALSMALHELSTNAAKYGAFSSPFGRVHVGWHVRDGRLYLQWQESNGPKVTHPTRRGFGSRLLEAGLLRDLHGTAKLDFLADGVRYEMSAPL